MDRDIYRLLIRLGRRNRPKNTTSFAVLGSPMALGLFELVVFILTAAFLAGLAGSVLGIGGGIFLVPYLTLGIGLGVREAVATSLIGVIATSSGAASVYVRDRLPNLRLGVGPGGGPNI